MAPQDQCIIPPLRKQTEYPVEQVFTRRALTLLDWSPAGHDGHRSVHHGYANPEIQDSVAKEAVKQIERWRDRWDIPSRRVFICGVDNSTTAFGMATIRHRYTNATIGGCYRFCSGRRDSDARDDVTDGMLSYYENIEDRPDNSLFVVIDDDMCKGKSLGTVAKRAPKGAKVCWIGIQQNIWDFYFMEDVPEWLFDVDELCWLESRHGFNPNRPSGCGTETGANIARVLTEQNE